MFYCNEKENLRVILEWCNSGWTSREAATADSNISGAKVKTLSSDTPWADILEVGEEVISKWYKTDLAALQVRKNPDSWMFTIQKKEGKVGQAINAVNNLAENSKKFKII